MTDTTIMIKHIITEDKNPQKTLLRQKPSAHTRPHKNAPKTVTEFDIRSINLLNFTANGETINIINTQKEIPTRTDKETFFKIYKLLFNI